MRRVVAGFSFSLSFAVIAAIAVACGDDDGGGGAAAPGGDAGVEGHVADGETTLDSGALAPPIAEGDFYAQFAAASCDNLQPCCADLGYDFVPGACEARLTPDGGFTGDQASLVDGRLRDAGLTYNPQMAGNCLASFREANRLCTVPTVDSQYVLYHALTPPLTGLFDCARVYTGKRGLGEACSSLDNCSLDFVCMDQQAPQDGGPPVGHCVTLETGLPEGASCTDLEPATPTDHYRWCDMSLPNHVEPATADGLLYCDPTTQVCKKFHVSPPGQACGDTSSCGRGYRCDTDASATCIPCGDDTKHGLCGEGTKPIGTACQDSSECLSGHCNFVNMTCGTKMTGRADEHLCTGK